MSGFKLLSDKKYRVCSKSGKCTYCKTKTETLPMIENNKGSETKIELCKNCIKQNANRITISI